MSILHDVQTYSRLLASDGTTLTETGNKLDVVEASATAIASSLVDIETNTDSLAVVGGGVEASAVRVTLASDSTGLLTVDNGGTFVTQIDGDALTSLQLLDDTINTLGSDSYTVSNSKGSLIGAVRNDTLASLTISDNDIAPLQVNSDGALYVDISSASVTVDSEFPAAATITDNFANPSTTSVMSMNMGWDGSAWDRMSGDSSNGLLVNLGTNNDVVEASASSILSDTTSIDGKLVTCDTSAVVIASGAIVATLSAVDNAVLDAIEVNTNGDATSATHDSFNVNSNMQISDSDLSFGQAVMASSLPVTIASNQSILPINFSSQSADITIADGGNSITIDNSDITTIAGAVKAEDSVHNSGDLGIMGLAVRNDSLATLVGTDGDYTALQVNASGSLYTIDEYTGTINTRAGVIQSNTAYGTVVGGGVEATALRVTLASDSTGVLSIDDNGGSITIDNSDLSSIAGTVSGSELQCDIVSSLPSGTNSIGKLAPNSGVDIGDVDVTSCPVIGTHGNMWSAVIPGINGKSTAIDCQYVKHIDVFGEVDGATVLTVEVSQDNSNWYSTYETLSPAGAEDFHMSFFSSARYIRLDNGLGSVTVTATLAGKH